MSASHDASSSSAHGPHAAHGSHADPHHAHAFDNEPVKVLPPDEPRTPAWVPALGLLLFVFGGVYVALSGDNAASGSATPEKTTAEARQAPAADAPAAR
ncbi:MAG TPA: hypothetical protein VK459_17200, partial [Polyangiaceae bacterium]|nr:hypothetical protein [Polyangiaceae bacterium]